MGLLEWKKESISIESLSRPEGIQENLDLARLVNRNGVTSDIGEAQWAASSDPGREGISQFLVHSSPAVWAGLKVYLFIFSNLYNPMWSSNSRPRDEGSHALPTEPARGWL